MPQRSRPKVGRPRGGKTQTIDVPGCPFLYYKPRFFAGKWRVRRRARPLPHLPGGDEGERERAEEAFTLGDAQSLGQAIQDTLELAREEARKAQEAAKPPEERALNPISLADGWAAWTAARTGLEAFRPSTLRLHETSKGKILAALGAHTLAHTVTLADVEKFFAGLRSAPRRKRKGSKKVSTGRAGRTLLLYAQKLRGLFKYLSKHGHIQANPMEEFEAPKAWSQDARAAASDTGRYLEPEEARRLIAAATDTYTVDFTPERFGSGTPAPRTPPRHLALAITVSLLSGLRKGNLVGPGAIRWGDLELEEGKETFTIDRARMKTGPRRLDGRAVEFFKVPLNAELAQILREERRRYQRLPRARDRVVGNMLDFKRSWSNAIKRANLPGLRFHDLRHTFSSWLGETAPMAIVERLLDHSPSKAVTLRYTKGVSMEAMREYLNKLPRLMENTPIAPLQKVDTGKGNVV